MTERTIDPYGLVSKAGVWYLIARQQDGEFRTFRVERIANTEESISRFERDEHFDLEAHWRSTNAAMQRPTEWYEVTLHVVTEFTEWVMSYNENSVVAEDEHGKTLKMRFHSQREAVHQTAAWGSRVRVLDPPELRQALAEHAREMLSLYARTGMLGNSDS